MKKTTTLATLAFSFILVASPLAAMAASSNSGNSDFNYIPQEIYQLASTQTVAGTNSPSFNPLTYCAGAGLVCYSPAFIRSAYDFPSTLTGAGETIVIVDAYGSPTIVNDLALFDSFFGIPAPPSFTVICPPGGCPTPSYVSNQGHFGGNPHGPFGWSIETSLDVEYAHAMAPGAKIVLDVAQSSSGNDINVAESSIIPMFPGAIMSQSFGIPEAAIHNNNAQVIQAENNYAMAASLGWTVFASAGDSGATNGYATANALFPSSDPLVTSVGGTQGLPYPGGLAAGSCPSTGSSCTPSGYGGEEVWNEPQYDAAGGGAPSLLFSGRSTPDVSYNAAVNGGVLVAWSACPSCIGATGPVFFIVGGTSAGSPQWAAIAALAEQAAARPLGSLNSAINAIGSSPAKYANDFHDITFGNNQLIGTSVGFSAGPGWDGASGWGTPNVANLIPDLVSPP
ncbi:MAG: S53 family peptidase [Nitrososphaerota archaeon]|nr:S53 family peptidase [Nitrososphaerota archaeon]MDG7023080.1 S53 family peptidase [Nitrososphaerota archaeon]